MAKRIVALLLLCSLLLTITGCFLETSKTYRYDLETGNQVYIKLTTSTLSSRNKYDLEVGPPFAVMCGSEIVSKGIFIPKEAYDEYVHAAAFDPKATNLEEGAKDDNQYLFWEYDGDDGTQYNYVIWIEDAGVGVLLHNTASEESARECFSRLTFSGEAD